MHSESVCVVTVTYGKRWGYLKVVLNEIIDHPNVFQIIVVNNASDEDISSKCQVLSKKIKVINLNENTGSALGYKIGISFALNHSNCKFLWLLDDDNKPESNALDELIINYNKINTNNRLIALLSLRKDRKEYLLSSLYGHSKGFFPLINSFLGVHYKDILVKIIRKLLNKKHYKKGLSMHIVDVPVAPYGGLFMKLEDIQKIGFPMEKFYLYADDHEFSHRIVKLGGKIYLVPKSEIKDLDKSWNKVDSKGFLFSLLKHESDSKVYYSIRNRIYFEKKDLVSNVFIYKINKLFFLIIIYLFSIILGKKERRWLIKKAIRHGEKGILGKMDIN